MLHGLAGRFPNHLESHSCGSGYRVQCRPARLIDHRDALHFQREGVPVRTDRQTTLRNWNDPVEARRRDWGMEIVYLVSGNRRSPKQGQSYVSEGTLLCCSAAPILSLHHAVVSCGTAKRDAISLVVGAHAREGAASGDSAFEMVDM